MSRASCRLTVGKKSLKTQVKNNAGGSAVFDETLVFDKPQGGHIVKVSAVRMLHICADFHLIIEEVQDMGDV